MVASTIFFESNGGQLRAEATVPEIRLAVGEPDLDIGNIETSLEALTGACYYMTVERNAYRFSLRENLNKRLAGRRASVQASRITERLRDAIRDVFKNGAKIEKQGAKIEPEFFPERSVQISDRPVLQLVVVAPDHTMEDGPATLAFIEVMIRECGTSARTLKSALIWVVAESAGDMREQMRTLLAWEDIQDEPTSSGSTKPRSDSSLRASSVAAVTSPRQSGAPTRTCCCSVRTTRSSGST